MVGGVGRAYLAGVQMSCDRQTGDWLTDRDPGRRLVLWQARKG